MPAPSIPTNFIVQQGDSRVFSQWDQNSQATSYQVQASLDNITFFQIANLSGSPLARTFTFQNKANLTQATQISISTASALIVGQQYVISSLGSTTGAQWAAIGASSTPAVGQVFVATATSGSGTGAVQFGITTGQQYFFQVQATNGSGSSGYTAAQGIIPCSAGKECLGNLRLYAQQRADRVGSNFVTTSEWNQYITKSYKELYDILIQKFGNDYYMSTPYAFLTSGTQQLYPLPDGQTQISVLGDGITPAPAFYKSLLVEVALNPNDPNSWVTLRKYMRIQQNLWNYPNIYTFRGVTNLRYRFTGDAIQLVPQTQAGQTVRVWYAPRPSVLLADTDTIDGISGWEQYVIVDAARKALLKEESDTMELVNEKRDLLIRINEAAENRDIGEPETVSDSKMRNLAWTDDSGYGSGSGMV